MWTLAGHVMRPERAAEDPGVVLNAWVFDASVRLGLPYTTWKNGLVVLHELSLADGPLSLPELAGALRRASGLGTIPPTGFCLDCATAHDPSPLGEESRDPEEYCSWSPVGELADFGAVTWAEAGPEGMVWLTPLGRMLADSIFVCWAPAPDASVAIAVEKVAHMPPRIKWRMMLPWLKQRPPADAVRELLSYAEPLAGTSEGWTALVLADAIGPAAIEVWREWGQRRGFGVYARDWLKNHGEPVPEVPADRVWHGIDDLLTVLSDDPDLVEDRLGQMLDLGMPAAVEEFVAGIRATGHPGVELIAEMLDNLREERS